MTDSTAEPTFPSIAGWEEYNELAVPVKHKGLIYQSWTDHKETPSGKLRIAWSPRYFIAAASQASAASTGDANLPNPIR